MGEGIGNEETQGYTPLEYSGRKMPDGKLVFTDPANPNEIFTPLFELHDDPKSIEVYVLYELTFGHRNDRAHQITHARRGGVVQQRTLNKLANSPYLVRREQVEEIVEAYEPLASEVEEALASGDATKLDALKNKITEFRRKYSWLYIQPQRG